MAVVWKVLAGGLLFLFSLLAQGSGHGKREVAGSSTFYLGQGRGIWRPLVQTMVNFSQIGSIKSTFQFRTFDPEGTIFYGDTKGGEDWFVLSLRKGIPLMQISKLGMLVSAAGGPKLNDGRWHTMEVSNQGKFVTLEVDGSDGLEVGMQSDQHEEPIDGRLRLALGGILINQDKLSVQFEPQMDGCVREGVWLNLSVPWETETGELWPCHENIQPGSYFPGAGLAVFNTSVFPLDEDKAVKIVLEGNFTLMKGTILSIKVPEDEPILTLTATDYTQINLNSPAMTVNMKKDLRRLTIKFDEHSLVVHEDEDFFASTPMHNPGLSGSWRNGLLAIGGQIDDDADDKQFLTGCLNKIQIQDEDVDLDLAAVKHESISAHSCPA